MIEIVVAACLTFAADVAADEVAVFFCQLRSLLRPSCECLAVVDLSENGCTAFIRTIGSGCKQCQVFCICTVIDCSSDQ